MEKVAIYGAGAFAESAYRHFESFSIAKVAGFVVEKEYLTQRKLRGLPVVEYKNITEAFPPDKYRAFVAVGAHELNEVRTTYYEEIKAKGYKFINCICPEVQVFPDVSVGENVYISIGSVVMPYVNIGNNVAFIASTIGHHSTIKDNALVSGSVLGARVTCGENTFVGMGSTVVSNVQIGKKSIIGAGSVIKQDVEPSSVYSPDCKTVKRAIDSSRLKLG